MSLSNDPITMLEIGCLRLLSVGILVLHKNTDSYACDSHAFKADRFLCCEVNLSGVTHSS